MDGLEWDSDPTAHVLSANVHRRHLTKGQQAMAVALAKPEPKRGMHSQLNNSTGDFDKASLSRARFVLRHCRDKAEEVLRNAKYPLTVAYEFDAHGHQKYARGNASCARTGTSTVWLQI